MIYIADIKMSAPCSMPLCHNVAKHSIHDIPGREQTGVVICGECLKGIVDAYNAPPAPIVEEAPPTLVVEEVEQAPVLEEVKVIAKKRPVAKKKPAVKR